MPQIFNYQFNFQFGFGISSGFIGLSITQPTPDGLNITEPTWEGYVRVPVNFDRWSVISQDTYRSTVMVAFPEFKIPPNTYYTVPYYVVYNSQGLFINAGSINPPAYLGPDATLTFNIGDFIIDFDKVSYSPDTSSVAFPVVLYPAFVPTYEPAALGQPILYAQNMRS